MKFFRRLLSATLVFLFANIHTFALIGNDEYPILFLTIAFIIINLFPTFQTYKGLKSNRLKVCESGIDLIVIFLISSVVSTIYLIIYFLTTWGDLEPFAIAALITIVSEAIIFWNGIIRIYCSSFQLGIKWRVIGLLCGMIPIVNIIVLVKLLHIANKEVNYENQKIVTNQERADLKLCQTKYPILFVHGVFFRDSKYFNYWGRIPKELITNGATIYYGNHESAASVIDSAKQLDMRIKEILDETGAEKVNIIAHSKGGLDSRCAISMFGSGDNIASLTTINTPHYGCIFAEELYYKFPEKMKSTVANNYNKTMKKFGDENPDFLAAIEDLTAGACAKFNQEMIDDPNVFYQSVGSKLNLALGGRFPLNFSHSLVKKYDGENDGLVSINSMWWGEQFPLITVDGLRGVSHGDMIDLNRENIDRFDVREYYVNLVHGLKKRGF